MITLRSVARLLRVVTLTLAACGGTTTPPPPDPDLASGGGGDLAQAAGDLAMPPADMTVGPPTNPANPQVIVAGQNISGNLPPATGPTPPPEAHYYKYVPAQAFTSVSVNVTTLGPTTAYGQMRWQTDTNLGLCDLTTGYYCCTAAGGPAFCHLTIREGTGPFGPVIAGQTYYVIAIAGGAPTNYAFSLVENP